MSQKILGFYRKHKKIVSLLSSQHSFFDYNLKQDYIPQLISIKLYQNESNWKFSSYVDCLDQTTRSILDQRMLWITDSHDTTPFYVLMYTPKNNLDMSRTGYLLVKHRDCLQPVCVAVEGKEYLIEIKGVGCPSGGFPHTHLRRQAGCYDKSHIRVTGGLFAKEAISEFDYLLKKETLYKKIGCQSHVKALAMTTFRHLDFEFGMLLRLTPSSFRASFTNHPDLDKLLNNRFNHAYFHMGKYAGALLQHKPPLKHQNLSLNNMVFINKTTFDLTDFSEIQELYRFTQILDYIQHVFPVLYLNYNIPLGHLNFFLKGINKLSKTRFKQFKLFSQTQATLSKILISSGSSYYDYVARNGLDFSGIIQNFNYLKSYFPVDYFKHSTSSWVEQYLQPSYKEKLTILTVLLDIRKKVPSNLLADVMKFNVTKSTKPYLASLLHDFPCLNDVKRHKTSGNLTQKTSMFVSIYNQLGDEFLIGLENINLHQYNIKKLTELLDQLNSLSCYKQLASHSFSDFLNFTFQPTYENLLYNLYPFLNIIYSFCYSQILFLRGAQNRGCLNTQAHIEQIQTYYQELINKCKTEPEQLKSLFCLDQPDTLIKKLSWPT